MLQKILFLTWALEILAPLQLPTPNWMLIRTSSDCFELSRMSLVILNFVAF